MSIGLWIDLPMNSLGFFSGGADGESDAHSEGLADRECGVQDKWGGGWGESMIEDMTSPTNDVTAMWQSTLKM